MKIAREDNAYHRIVEVDSKQVSTGSGCDFCRRATRQPSALPAVAAMRPRSHSALTEYQAIRASSHSELTMLQKYEVLVFEPHRHSLTLGEAVSQCFKGCAPANWYALSDLRAILLDSSSYHDENCSRAQPMEGVVSNGDKCSWARNVCCFSSEHPKRFETQHASNPTLFWTSITKISCWHLLMNTSRQEIRTSNGWQRNTIEHVVVEQESIQRLFLCSLLDPDCINYLSTKQVLRPSG